MLFLFLKFLILRIIYVGYPHLPHTDQCSSCVHEEGPFRPFSWCFYVVCPKIIHTVGICLCWVDLKESTLGLFLEDIHTVLASRRPHKEPGLFRGFQPWHCSWLLYFGISLSSLCCLVSWWTKGTDLCWWIHSFSWKFGLSQSSWFLQLPGSLRKLMGQTLVSPASLLFCKECGDDS